MRYLPLLFFAGFLAAGNAAADHQELLIVKVDGFSDTKLILVTDAENRIQGVKIANGQVSKTFTAEQFREGYTYRYYTFKAVSIHAPNLSATEGGLIQIEYRKDAKMISDFERVEARLKRDASGKWILERKGSPISVLELAVRKERTGKDKAGKDQYKFLGVDGYKFSAIPDFNRAVAQLAPDDRRADRMAYENYGNPTLATDRLVVAQVLPADVEPGSVASEAGR